MKKQISYYLIAFLTIYACGKKNKINKNHINNSEKKISKTYIRKGNCDNLIANIDFSSFCFTSKKTPKYRLVQNSETNCQYEIYNDAGHQNIDFSIVFSDFQKVFGKEAQPELAKQIFTTIFNKKKKTRMIPSGSKEITGLGDDAYIGFSQSKNNKDQYLGVRIGNVAFTFVFHHGKNKSSQSCMQTEKDLIKIGQLVVKNITK
ncbi:hypothetical protein LPB136_00860 [Tenacibaculum todarodis]|uniref:Uncharacterized protein n=1 Tax=Tenacibaculum todarodis TaxID=1850252 RepID=A0A1L3JFT7_9FLAO|nr:hypothetical protein [Tenacibaculum todarodis]APG64005.1 hypothetical protein LPB136_00860 [Tenacibaculum todarodis]